MRINDSGIKMFLIFVTAVCLSVTGCDNAEDIESQLQLIADDYEFVVEAV